jgi:hypothetical protein
MPYIIEDANILKGNQLIKNSILVSENRISAFSKNFKQYRFMKMNADSFIMTPSYAVLDSHIPHSGSCEFLKEYMVTEFLLKGCTTFLTYVNVSYERELVEKLLDMKTALSSSPIDYVIGVRIPLSLINASFIRRCKKERIPAIFIEIQNRNEFRNIPWSRIREAIFPFNCSLIPVLTEQVKDDEKAILASWVKTMKKEKIPFVNDVIQEHLPLSATVLNKIGLYPQKSCLMHGSELSYNLYLMDKDAKNIDDHQLFLYHRDKLVITVHKGKVIRAGKEVLYNPGNGEYVKVKTPSYFSFE